MPEHMPPQFNEFNVDPAQAEQQLAAPESALADVAVAIAGWLDGYASESPQGQIELREEYEAETPYMLEILKQDERYTDAELEEYFGLLSQVKTVANIDWPLELMVNIPVDRRLHHFENYSGIHDLLSGRAEEVSKKTSLSEERMDFAAIFHDASGGKYGEPLLWLNESGLPQQGLPEYMHSFVTDERFAGTALGLIRNRQPHETNAEFTDRIRCTERIILERYTPIVGELSSRFRLSLDARTMRLDDEYEVIPMSDPDGSVDFDEWQLSMKAAIKSTTAFVPDELQSLYKNAGIVNFDRYSGKQLDRMLKVLQGDAVTIEYLKKRDVTVSMLDAYGDYNNSSAETPAVAEKDSLLVYEVERPSQLLRHIISLVRKTGIIPSGIIPSAHGNLGAMYWGEDDSEFVIVSDTKFAPKGSRAIDVSKATMLGRFLRTYMQPHSETNERYITLDSCLQGELMYPGGINNPVAILSHTTEADRVVVRAMSKSGSLKKVQYVEDQTFAYVDDQDPLKTREFRALPTGMESDGVHPAKYSVTETDSFRYV